MERFSLCHSEGKETREFQRMVYAHAIMNSLLQSCDETEAWSDEFNAQLKEAHQAFTTPISRAQFRQVLSRARDQLEEK